MKMKMKLIYSFIGISTIVLGLSFGLSSRGPTNRTRFVGGTPSINNKAEANQEFQSPLSTGIGTPLLAYSLSNKEKALAEKEIGEINNESTLIQRMIEMSLQKVQIGKNKYGIPWIPSDKIHRILMSKGNIEYLREKLDLIKTTRDEPFGDYTYENILNRWLEGNFKNVINAVKTLRSDMLKPNQNKDSFKVSRRSYSEEQKYIIHFFYS